MEAFTQGLQYFLSDPSVFLVLTFGVFFGIVFGAIPGLTATLGVILLLPFTYTMAPALGMTLLIGIYVGGISGGLITAILINIPGTPSSIITCFDGYPMAKNGRAGDALSIGVFASLIGGLVSALALIFISPPLSKIVLMFGAWEYFTFALLGLSMVVSVVAVDIIKGLMGALLGLLFATVGMDTVTGMMRLTFGQWQLEGGISVTALMMGLFATREIMIQSRDLGTGMGKVTATNKVPFFPKWSDLKGTGVPFTLGSIIGIIIGILPGIGQQTASLLTYNQSRQLSKHPEKFGTGIPEGIVASECANNAVNGGALIALMTLGIPGDMVTAVLLGGLMIHGLQPGPLFFTTHIDIVGAVMITYFVANIIMFIMELGMMKVFIKIVNVPYYYLFPTILLTCIVGVFAMNNRIFDIWILIGFGLVGYALSEFGVNMEPLMLGFILGPLVEKNFRTALIGSSGQFSEILTRPVATTFLILSIIFILWPILKPMFKQLGGNKLGRAR